MASPSGSLKGPHAPRSSLVMSTRLLETWRCMLDNYILFLVFRHSCKLAGKCLSDKICFTVCRFLQPRLLRTPVPFSVQKLRNLCSLCPGRDSSVGDQWRTQNSTMDPSALHNVPGTIPKDRSSFANSFLLLVVTSATLVVTGALLVVTKSY